MHGRAKHVGCSRGGWLTHTVEPMFGLSVENCTDCAHRRVIVAEVAVPKTSNKKQAADAWWERQRERTFQALPVGRDNAVSIGVLAQRTGMSVAGAHRAVNRLLVRRQNVRYTTVTRVGSGSGPRTLRVYWRDGGTA